MLLLGLDLETTGIDFKESRVTEVGAVLYDTEDGPLVVYNALVKEFDLETVPEKIVNLTGITFKMLDRWGVKPDEVIENLEDLFLAADYVVAHNGNGFDKPMLESFFYRNGKDSTYDTPWLDTSTDVPYPENCKYTNLTYLSGYYAIPNPFAHRAVTDVFTMLKVLENFDLNEVIEISKSDTVRFKSLLGFHDKEICKDAGFKWTPGDHATKGWFKEMKTHGLDMDKVKSGKFWDFPTEYEVIPNA